jgi:hypothetical protein
MVNRSYQPEASGSHPRQSVDFDWNAYTTVDDDYIPEAEDNEESDDEYEPGGNISIKNVYTSN